MISDLANSIFDAAIKDYHIHDEIDLPIQNPYPAERIEHLFYLKCWIDTMQWHMEDEIRDPNINPTEALKWKRRIDQSNQHRTDTVEYIDGYFLNKYNTITPQPDSTINTESLAWAIDRLSILALKIYHMRLETLREDAGHEHREACQAKLDVLTEQRTDLSTSIDELLNDIIEGKKIMKVYKQMKMYNDPSLNPVLYSSK